MAEIKGAKLLNAREVQLELKKIMRNHRIACQKAIAETMTRVRFRASEYIIANTTGIYNPYYARKKQPNVPGRLTNRTGKLKLMLANRASNTNPLKGWINFGSKLAKQESVMLQSYVRAEDITKESETYRGTVRVWFKGGDPRLFDTVRGQPQESVKTLAVRFNWETGIRGETRPFIAPVNKQAEYDLTKLTREKNEKIWRLH